MTKTKEWLQEIGWQILNSKLVNYVGLNIGTIPITNLEFIPSWVDLKELASLISDDGCPAKYTCVQGPDVILYIK